MSKDAFPSGRWGGQPVARSASCDTQRDNEQDGWRVYVTLTDGTTLTSIMGVIDKPKQSDILRYYMNFSALFLPVKGK